MKLFTTLRLSYTDKEVLERFVQDLDQFDRLGVEVSFLVKDRSA